MGLIIDIADAVAGELNAAPPGTFSAPFTALRRVLPQFDLPDLAQLKVVVVPKSILATASTRSATLLDATIDIGVIRKLGQDLDSEVADLSDLVDQIGTYLRQRPLAGAPAAVWVRMQNDPVYAPDHLAEQRTFMSVLGVVYRVLR
jgi:hypothetical protein